MLVGSEFVRESPTPEFRTDRWSTNPEDLTRDADLFVEMWDGGRERGKEC